MVSDLVAGGAFAQFLTLGLANEAHLRTTATEDDGKPSPSLAILQQEWAYQSQDAGVLLHILFF